MPLSQDFQSRITTLKEQYDRAKVGKESLLVLIDEAELSEGIYNSNAIENSTLTLPETEKILLELEVSRDVDLREVFEVKNLARATKYLHDNALGKELNRDIMLLLHQILMSNIHDDFGGRFRTQGEYVRVGTHIAPSPRQLETMVGDMFVGYTSNFGNYFLDKIAYFHLELETIHPFNDGNGRVGRLAINWHLVRLGFPSLILRDKEKDEYYQAFAEYRNNKANKTMVRILALALLESLHKRTTYLKGLPIIKLTDYAKNLAKPAPVLLNAAKRQSIPAFREKGVWKIGVD